MPRGSGIYEDEPREHRKVFSVNEQHDDGGDDPTPDVPDSGETTEPPD